MKNLNLIKVAGVRFTEDIYSKLKAIANARGEDVSDFIRRAILKELAALNFLSEFENKALGVNLKLNPWDELSAAYKALDVDEDHITLTLTTTPKDLQITYPKDSLEAQTLTEALKNTPAGTKIALLKTDIPEKPLVIRTLTDTTVADKGSCRLPRCRKSIFAIAVKGWLRSSFRYCCSGCV